MIRNGAGHEADQGQVEAEAVADEPRRAAPGLPEAEAAAALALDREAQQPLARRRAPEVQQQRLRDKKGREGD